MLVRVQSSGRFEAQSGISEEFILPSFLGAAGGGGGGGEREGEGWRKRETEKKERFFFFLFPVFLFFETDGVSRYSPGCPRARSVDHGVLEGTLFNNKEKAAALPRFREEGLGFV